MTPLIRKRFYDVALTIILLLFTAAILVPFVWMIVMSFRTTAEILNDPYGLPSVLRWRNYYDLLFDPRIKFYRYFINSALISGGALVLTIILSCLGGYGFARKRFRFKYRNVMFAIMLFSLMLPVQALYIPQFIMMAKYGLLNTRTGVILLYTAISITMSTFLMKTYFSQLPEELEEAARIDGASDFRIFWHIMLPMSRPALATVIIFNFMMLWNELLIALTMITTPDKRTLPLAMMNFVGESGSDYAMAAASLVMGMLPVVILYVALSERFVKGMTAGALKG